MLYTSVQVILNVCFLLHYQMNTKGRHFFRASEMVVK